MVENKYEILRNALEYGILDLEYLRATLDMTKKQEILSSHPYAIYQGKDGKFYTYLPDSQKGRIKKKRNSQAEIEQAIIAFYTEQAENPTLEEQFRSWNDERLAQKEICAATHFRYQAQFEQFYAEIKGKKIKSVTPDFMEIFLTKQISEKNLTAKAFANLRSLTKGFFKKARKEKWIDWSIETVFLDLDVPKQRFKRVMKESYQEVFSEQEMVTVLKYLKNHLDTVNLGILLLFVTGIRVGELVTLKHSDFDGTVFNIRRTATSYKPNKDSNYVYEVKNFPKTAAGFRLALIPPDYAWLAEEIRKCNPDSEYIFAENGTPFKTNIIRDRLYQICRKLGIYKKSPHKIRKTYGTILIDSKVDTKMITDLMGHTSILCTEEHYHRNRKSIAKKSEILGAIPDFQANF